MNTEKELVEMVNNYHGKVLDIFRNELDEDLSEYEIVIDYYEGESIASCDLKKKQFQYHILNNDYLNNLEKTDLKKLILESAIHEQCHAIAKRYNLQDDLFGSDHHNLSFGLMCLCVENKIINNAELVYRAYDFSEDMYLYRYVTPHSKAYKKDELGRDLTKEEIEFNLKRDFNQKLSKEVQEKIKKSVLNHAQTMKFSTAKELALKCKKYSENLREYYGLEFELI